MFSWSSISTHIGNQKGNGIGLVGFQSLCIAVYLVIQFLNCVFHSHTIGFAYRKPVYDLGYGSERYPHISLILVSMGKDGSRAYYKDVKAEIPAFIQKNTMETTGAGDTFCGCMLHGICKYGLENLDEAKLEQMITFANGAASLITTRKGALRVMPSEEEIVSLTNKL